MFLVEPSNQSQARRWLRLVTGERASVQYAVVVASKAAVCRLVCEVSLIEPDAGRGGERKEHCEDRDH